MTAANGGKSNAGNGTPDSAKPATISDYDGLSHSPALSKLKDAQRNTCTVKGLHIKVKDGPNGTVPAFLHLPRAFEGSDRHSSSGSVDSLPKTAAILVSGAGGGVVGPSSIYLSLADKLTSLANGLPVMRLDYRFPARTTHCVDDVRAAMSYLESTYKLERFVLVGWSFGGAVVFTMGGNDKRIAGVATVASQTADASGVAQMPPRPVLLLHGTGDQTLSPACSEMLRGLYRGNGDCRLELFKGDDHALTRNSLQAERMIAEFIMRCAGLEISQEEQNDVLAQRLVGETEKVEKMQRGGDLRGQENVS